MLADESSGFRSFSAHESADGTRCDFMEGTEFPALSFRTCRASSEDEADSQALGVEEHSDPEYEDRFKCGQPADDQDLPSVADIHRMRFEKQLFALSMKSQI